MAGGGSWLKTEIENLAIFKPINGQLLNYPWWDTLSTELNGIPRDFLHTEFAKMAAWYMENPKRRPTAKGVQRFVRTWLERAKEKERRNYGNRK